MTTVDVSSLPEVKLQAVRNAHAAWIAAGLSPVIAERRAAVYAHKLVLQRERAIKRVRRTTHAQPMMHAAADQHLDAVTAHFSKAFASARASMGSKSELEHLVATKNRVAMDAVIAHVPAMIEHALREQLPSLLLGAMTAGASVTVKQLKKIAS